MLRPPCPPPSPHDDADQLPARHDEFDDFLPLGVALDVGFRQRSGLMAFSPAAAGCLLQYFSWLEATYFDNPQGLVLYPANVSLGITYGYHS